MRLSATPPDVKPNGMYRTNEAAALLGMARTSFWRCVTKGLIKRKYHKADLQPRYSGKEILRFYNCYCG